MDGHLDPCSKEDMPRSVENQRYYITCICSSLMLKMRERAMRMHGSLDENALSLKRMMKRCKMPSILESHKKYGPVPPWILRAKDDRLGFQCRLVIHC